MDKTIKKYENLLPIPGEITKIGLVLPEGLAFKDWDNIGSCLRLVEGSMQWWVGDWLNYGERSYGEMYAQAIDETDLSYGRLRNIKFVASNIELSRRRDNLTFTHHEEVASLSSKEQDLFLNKASDENLSVRDLREAIRKSGVKFNKNIEPIKGKYQVFYADPPWSYGNEMPKGTTTPANYYPQMSIEEICNMPIKSVTDENAVLFLWVTSPLLKESFDVIEAWGFEYKTSFVWDKIKHNMGHYNSVRHEFLLLCIKGSYPIQNVKLYDSVLTEERTEHSKKPDFFYEMIEDLYPNSNKIELFSRKERKGWTNYGNQIQSK
jgi:N6-adenosine-specific RNA methylase IME4